MHYRYAIAALLIECILIAFPIDVLAQDACNKYCSILLRVSNVTIDEENFEGTIERLQKAENLPKLRHENFLHVLRGEDLQLRLFHMLGERKRNRLTKKYCAEENGWAKEGVLLVFEYKSGTKVLEIGLPNFSIWTKRQNFSVRKEDVHPLGSCLEVSRAFVTTPNAINIEYGELLDNVLYRIVYNNGGKCCYSEEKYLLISATKNSREISIMKTKNAIRRQWVDPEGAKKLLIEALRADPGLDTANRTLNRIEDRYRKVVE